MLFKVKRKGSKVKAYKAFNKDMTCRGFQFAEGLTYETEKAELCKSGFHYCENPLDVLDYYDLCDSEIHEVEILGKKTKNDEDCSKRATTKIKIGAKLDLDTFIKASFGFLSKLVSSGNNSKLASSGGYSQLASSGRYSQ